MAVPVAASVAGAILLVVVIVAIYMIRRFVKLVEHITSRLDSQLTCYTYPGNMYLCNSASFSAWQTDLQQGVKRILLQSPRNDLLQNLCP